MLTVTVERVKVSIVAASLGQCRRTAEGSAESSNYILYNNKAAGRIYNFGENKVDSRATAYYDFRHSSSKHTLF